MTLPWIKLYCEILEDPKMGRLPEWLFARFVKLLLMAGRERKDGLLPPVEDMLWTLRPLEEGKLMESLRMLAEVGITAQSDDGRWFIVNFAKRQASDDPTVNERMKKYRTKLREELRVTDSVSISTSSSTSLTDAPNICETQRILEAVVGLPVMPADVPGMDELERLHITEDDARGALQWRKDNGRPPVKTLSQLYPGIKTQYSIRTQGANARPSQAGQPLTLEEEIKLARRREGLE